MSKNNRHTLWNEELKEATEFFSSYYFDGAVHDIADTDEKIIEKVFEWDGKKFAEKIAEQLKKLIDSDMEDNELRNFIHEKLGSDYFAAQGESRDWLIFIYNYIKKKLGEKQKGKP
tara:strand:+ start:339 stop:686 length:348 start_codon:yes stop_codon:yes gene_type:complete